MLTCRSLPLFLLSLLLSLLLWGRGGSAVPGARQPAHRPYPNVPEAQPARSFHTRSPLPNIPQHHQPAAATRQPLVQQHQQPLPPGRQRSAEHQEPHRSDQGVMPHGDGPGAKAASPAPQPGQSREQSKAGRGRPLLSQSGNRDQDKEMQRKSLEMTYKQQVERRRQQQEAVRKQQEEIHKQQDEIRKHLEADHQLRHQRMEQDERRQQRDQQQFANHADVANNAEDTLKRNSATASRSRLQRAGTGGGGVALNANNNARDTNNNNNDEVPDAPHGTSNNNNNNNKFINGLSDEFRRGMIRKVYKEEDSNMNNMPMQRNAFPPEQPLRHLGGMSISWDWDDFSLSFQNYGVAEMKVRRAPHATTGEPWPLPQYYTKKDKNILVVDPKFEFVVSSNITCDIVEQAMERYKRRIVEQSLEDMYDNLQNAEGTGLEVPEDKYASNLFRSAPRLSRFSLKIRRPCSAFPSLESDESYDLVVKKSSAYLWANEVWGLLRGMETLSQLVWKGPDGRLYVKESVISDYPRFPHRGILLDSSRHFIFKEVIFDMMDAMEMNKMNVLHWHIVDDQSFPYESKVFPELSAKGAYHPTFVYSLSDIAEIIDYGRMRGIRILPEFDSPGHTYSWGFSRPELLTQCYSGSSQVKGYLGPIDPVRNSTYRFLKTLFGEILHVFKDEYLHLGGDEVPLGCWQSNPDVVKFGKVLNKEDSNSPDNDQQSYFGEVSPSIRLVYEYYVNRLMKDIKDLGKKRDGIKFIMWQEVMNNDLKLPNDTLIQVWMGDMADVSRAIGLGYNVLYSSCWYLDHVEYGVKWPKYYQCDPADGTYGYRIDEKKVKGGEACLWSEYIDNESLLQTTWPRASAVAERLWSSKDTKNLDAAGERLSEHRCRMLKRGLSVGQISGPDYCLRPGVTRGRLRAPAAKCQGAGCKAEVASEPVETHSDIKFRVRTEGGGSADCSWMGGNITILFLLLLIAFILLLSLSRSSGKLYALRVCRHRTILLVFIAVLFIYFMCYTTMWMHVFEFSGSFQHKRHAS